MMMHFQNDMKVSVSALKDVMTVGYHIWGKSKLSSACHRIFLPSIRGHFFRNSKRQDTVLAELCISSSFILPVTSLHNSHSLERN